MCGRTVDRSATNFTNRHYEGRFMPRMGLILLGLLFSMLLAMPAAAEQLGFRWQHDIEAAKALAKQSGRLVLVHFWSPSCGPCVAMEQTVFNQPGVAGAVESYYVPVKLNAEQHAATAQQYGVTRIPTDVVLTADGSMIGKMVSPSTPAAYVAELQQVATRTGAKPQPFTSAAAEAPQPSNINEAYANLNLGAAPTSPASSPFQGVPSDPYAQSQFLGNSPASQSPYASAVATAAAPYGQPAPAGQTAGYTPAAYQQPLAAPGSNTSAAGLNPYSPTQPSAGYAATGQAPQPSRVANPYTFSAPPLPVAATSEPIEKYTQPAAPTPPAAAASVATNVAPPITPITPEPAQVATSSTGTVATPDGRILPPGAPPLGFDGYCPVTMRSAWKWQPGDPKWGAIHRGRTFWFAGQAEQQQFLANPDYYSPALSGMDPVLAIDHRQTVPGKREHSIDYDNQFYLFSSEASLQQFTSNPERYSTGVRQAMGIQPTRTTVR